MKTIKLKCGCRYERERDRMLELCPAHLAEFNETHVRWAEEHRKAREAEERAAKDGKR